MPAALNESKALYYLPMTISLELGAPVEWVDLSQGGLGSIRIVVDALHDGDLLFAPGPLAARPEVRSAFESRRAVGTADFARQLAFRLGEPGFLSARVARVTLDFDRPPGFDPVTSSMALGPLGGLIGPDGRRRLIEQTYREGLKALSETRVGADLAVSVLAREDTSSRVRLGVGSKPPIDANVPWGWLEALIPPILLERTANPLLVDALAEELRDELEPDGPESRLDPNSLAIRAIVFDWMKYLQEELESRGPGRGERLDPSGRRVWSALLDTSGMSSDTRGIAAFIQHGLEPPRTELHLFPTMEAIYRSLERWVQNHGDDLLKTWFQSRRAKDHLVVFIPRGLSKSRIDDLSERMALAIRAYA